MNIIILAAGKGSRMKSSVPKVLQQIGGKAMISHVVETALALNPKKIFIIVSENKNEIEVELSVLNKNSLISFIDQSPALGTGHAVMMAVPYLNPSFNTLVLYGDVPLITTSTLRKLCKSSKVPVLKVLTAIVEDPKGYGRIIRDSKGRIENCIEEKDAKKHIQKINEVNTGIMFASTPNLKDWLSKIDKKNSQNEYYLTQIILHANAENIPVKPVLTSNTYEIYGINSLLQKSKVERIFQRGLAETFSNKGLEITDLNRFDVRGELTFATNAKVDIGCVFIGKVSIGKGVIIEPYCVIKNSSIGNNTLIKAFTHIEDSSVGANSTIGPYSRLRSNSLIEDNCKVGNFVETKNIKFNKNSKVNHLSYIGDAKIGKNVNIGAGTITCNYDGDEKHQTVVEDDSFIGSNSELIAPVRIEKGATVGAGTTLTEDAPRESLTISRTKQVTIVGWKRSKKKYKSKK